jgi:cold shock CspA family protein
MRREYFYGTARKVGPARSGTFARPVAPSGKSFAGRIVKLLVGQGHGFIRLSNDREIFFHRADVQDGTSFNTLRAGDDVRFELLEDSVSGPRALSVRRRQRVR